MNYWTPARLVNHLKYSDDCAKHMVQYAEVDDPVPGINSKVFKRNTNPALCPPVDAAFQVTNVNRNQLTDHPETEPWLPLTEQLLEIILSDPRQEEDFTTVGAMMSQVRRLRSALQSFPISFEHIQLTWKVLRRDWKQVDIADADALIPVWQKVLDVVDVALCPAWLVPNNEKVHVESERFAPYSWLMEEEAIKNVHRHTPPSPSSPFRERFIVHVFSGHRREGDLQEKIEGLNLCDALLLHVISLDVVFGEEGNLFHHTTRLRWIHLFQDRMVLGFFAGPPCESWSGARFENSEETRIRPVRSPDRPWGLASMSLKEITQVVVGNVLMFFVLILLIIQFCNGLFGCLEHPSPPREKHKPSIWKTALWKFLDKLGLRSAEVFQGLYGAPSKKPTVFAFTVEIEGLRNIFRDCQTRFDIPKECSIGRTADGQFATARLKQYPQALCQALAQCFKQWYAGVSFGNSPIPDEARKLLLAFESKLDAAMGLDFCPAKSRIIHFA